MKRLLISVSITFVFLMPLYSQNLSAVKTQLDAMFAGLDKTKVPTGFLWDTATNLVEADDHNGTALTDSNYVDLPRLHDMITSINSASVGADTIPASSAIRRIQQPSSRSNAVVGFLFQPYNRIVASALNNNLINYTNGVVSDKFVNGVWQNPYMEDVLVGFAVGNNGEVGTSVSYTLSNVDSLSTQTFTSINFDAGDGFGYRNVSIGQSINVSYTSIGYKEVKLKLVTNNHTYLCHSIINVIPPSPAYTRRYTSSNMNTHSFTVVYQGEQYHAKVCYPKPASFNNPLIIAEGFDPWRLKTAEDTNTTHEYSGFTTMSTFISAIGTSYFSSKDIFYIDWYDCGADIRANAKLLEEVINWVNDNKSSGNANVVLGQSMGGLIARYCLCDMESRGVAHDTEVFISHDAPHHGVNISPGLMFAYWDLYRFLDPNSYLISMFYGEENITTEYLRLGDYTSVKQMLLQYVDLYGNYNNSVYMSFQQELDNIGFPQGDVGKHLDNVVIVNGGKTSNGNASMYNLSDKLIDINFNASTGVLLDLLSFISPIKFDPLPLLLGQSSVAFEYVVYPHLSANCLVRSYSLVYTKKLLWTIPLTYVLEQENNYAPASSPCFDLYSSSYYPDEDINWNQIDTLSNGGMGSFSLDINGVNKIAFVPTASALCSYNYNQDFYQTPPVVGVQIPFDSYIVRDTNSFHTSFLNEMETWLGHVLIDANVPPVVFGGESLSVSGATLPFTWSASPSSIATINNGTVSRISNGLAEFKATYTSSGQAISKPRKAIVGYPEVALSSENPNGNYLVVKASASSPMHNGLIKRAVEDGILQYHWGVKVGTGSSISWRYTQNDTIHVAIPNTQQPVIVYMNWRHGNIEEQGVRSLQVFYPNLYTKNITEISVSSIDNTISYLSDPSLSFPSVTGQFYNICLVFSGTDVPQGAPEIQSITIGASTFSVSKTETIQNQDGTETKVFVFNILYRSTFHNTFINDPRLIFPGIFPLDIYLNDSGGPFQKTSIPVIKVTQIQQ